MLYYCGEHYFLLYPQATVVVRRKYGLLLATKKRADLNISLKSMNSLR